MFPQSWVQQAINDPPGALTGGNATAALFTAIANCMAVPGDWALPDANPQKTYTVTSGNPPVTQTFETGSKLQQQLRLGSAQGNALDFAALDFFGQTLPRNPGESDAAYFARIQLSLFNQLTITEPNVRAWLTKYTGINPHFINPNVPGDVGGYSGATGAVTLVHGQLVYISLVTSSQTHKLAPPSYYGVDTGGAPFRYANANGNGNGTGVLHGDVNPGFGYQVFIDTTYPLGWGAQGNAAGGYATTLPIVYPPSAPTAPTTEHVGSNTVFTNVAASTGYVSCSGITSMNGQSYFSTVVGGPVNATETVVAYFWPLGLTPTGLANGRSQLLTALNKLRAAGYSFWVQTLGAAALNAKGWAT
jgi:hypothetical protein